MVAVVRMIATLSIQVAALTLLAQLLVLFNSLALCTDRNQKCSLHVIMEHLASAYDSSAAEPRGGSSTFRP